MRALILIFFATLLFAWQADFENDLLGPYTKKEWQKDFPNAKGYLSSGILQKRIYIEKNDSKVLCVRFKKGLSSKGGAKWRMPFSAKNSVTLEYELFFQKGFNFNKGGKLPGIGGGEAPTGGKTQKKGYSVRFMWYSSGTKNSINNPNFANLFLYMYLPNQKQKYGLNIPLNTLIIPNKKYKIKLFVSKDGIIKVWVNEKLKLTKKFNLNKIPPNQLLFHTFFGGHTKKWASPKDQQVCFDNFKISQ